MQRMRKLRRPHKALWRLLLFTLSDKPGWFLKVGKISHSGNDFNPKYKSGHHHENASLDRSQQ